MVGVVGVRGGSGPLNTLITKELQAMVLWAVRWWSGARTRVVGGRRGSVRGMGGVGGVRGGGGVGGVGGEGDVGGGGGGGAGMHWRPLNTLITKELQALVLWAVRVVERCENQGSGGAEG